MSVPLPGWFSAEQERPIGGQLEDGIHGLLLDTHYGDRLANGRVRTYFGSPEDLRRATAQDGVSPASVQAALRLRDRLGFRGEGTAACTCATASASSAPRRWRTGSTDIHDFLATHPAEIVVMVNQDYVTPADFVKAVDDAGPRAPTRSRRRAAATWPTLREMIDDGRRLVMLAENHAGAAPWYQLAYDRADVEETPFDVRLARPR